MSNDPYNRELAELAEINKKPFFKRLGYFARKSGPGWLQGAITLGGGSLAGALYLGVISGYNLMWLQPMAMVLGVVMLSAIAYVTLTTQRSPFRLINERLSPALGWAWIIATVMANIIWCMPQFALGSQAILQNLMPRLEDGGNAYNIGLSGAEGQSMFNLGLDSNLLLICCILFIIGFLVNYFYGSGNAGIKIFEIILKVMVGLVVLSFFAVVVMLAAKGAIDWGAIAKGLIPNFTYLKETAPAYNDLIAASPAPEFWKDFIAGQQRDKIITAFGTAVGINMTFLLPYSMLRKRWTRSHRQLAIVDLSIGLIVPFVLATACVVIASSSQFHAQTGDVIAAADTEMPDGTTVKEGDVFPKMKVAFGKMISAREGGSEAALTDEDRKLAAMVANRDNFNLANSLQPLAGDFVAQKVFGFGVLAMAISTIIILMLINGFAFCELFGSPGNRGIHLLGCIVAGVGGMLGPFLWTGDAKAALAIPTSVIGTAMIPIAYYTFFLVMNSRSILGDHMPRGFSRVVWNVLMLLATAAGTFAAVWGLLGKSGIMKHLKSGDSWGAYFDALNWKTMIGLGGLIMLALLFIVGTIGFIINNKKDYRDQQYG